jgi:hypothetical protein
MKKIPGVVNGTYTFHNMIGRNYGNYSLSWEGKDPNATSISKALEQDIILLKQWA